MTKLTSRIAFVATQYGVAVLEGLRADRTLREKPVMAEEAVKMLLACDPTREGKDKPGRYLPWLCQCYQREWKAAQKQNRDHTMLAEDFVRIEGYLREYETLKIKNKLPAEKRDISSLTFAGLKETVIAARERVQDIPVSPETMEQSTILYNGAAGLVIVPHSTAASCAWGRGTEWCTAAVTSKNYFQIYNKDGPLIIIKTESGQKYQMHANSELMDVHDEQAKELPRVFLDSLPQKLQEVLNGHCKTKLYVPDRQEAQPEKLKQDGDRAITPDFKEKFGAILQNASAEQRADWEIALEAVQNFGFALESVSEELKGDREIVLAAVRSRGEALKHASEKLKADREIVLEAVRQCGRSLKYANEDLQADGEIVLAAVRDDPYRIRLAGDALRNDWDFALRVIQQKGATLRHVADELNTDPEFVLTAIRLNAEAYDFADSEFTSDPEFRERAVAENIEVINHLGDTALARISQSALQQGYRTTITNDWTAIRYFHDYGAGTVMTPANELEIFERGLADKKKPLTAKHLHLFPSLRKDGRL